MAAHPRMPAQLHTPTHSFSEAPVQTPNSTSAAKTSAAQDRSDRELFALTKHLSDQKFNIAMYPDPLLPRQVTQDMHYPRGVTAEMEAYLQAVAARIKGAALESDGSM